MTTLRICVYYALLFASTPLFAIKTIDHASEKAIKKIQDHAEISIPERLKLDDVRFLQLEFVDLLGNPHSYTLTAEMAEMACSRGINFDGSSITGYSSINESDLLLIPDSSTYVVLPWTKDKARTASLICDIYTEAGTPYPCSPRAILKAASSAAAAVGYTFVVSPELEFFIYKKTKDSVAPVLVDQNKYCECAEQDQLNTLKHHMLMMLSKLKVNPEKIHHEVAPSQHEVTLRYDAALLIADRMIRVKNALIALAREAGYEITFMPKPVLGQNGSGMHIHYSLKQTDGSNAFYDATAPHYLSNVATQFIAGNLHHIRSLCAVFNPTINSYKRLVKGYEAPIYISWGACNRSALIRIPHVNKGEGNAVRAEIRCPDPMANLYLTFALLLYSGLDGIAQNRQLPTELSENLFKLSPQERLQRNIATLPTSLRESLDAFSANATIHTWLGKELVERYCTIKERELAAFNQAVTDWELERYL